jgi:8-oxo-dGTP pyrophosphatase MutT (NUDIX family)
MENPIVFETKELEGWEGIFGDELLSRSMLKRAVINPPEQLQKGQKWSALNSKYWEELNEVAKKYDRDPNIVNNQLLAFQSWRFGTYQLELSRTLQDLENRGIQKGDRRIDEGETSDVVISTSQISYYEAVAFANGEINGLENPMPLLVSLNVVTSDGYLVFFNRGDNSSAGKNKIGITGGTCDADKEPYEQALLEAHEELGIPVEILDEDQLNLSNLILDKQGRPVLFYKIDTSRTKAQIEKTWNRDEHKGIIFVKNDDKSLLEFAKKHPSVDFAPPADALLIIAIDDAIQKDNSSKQN